MYETFTSVEKLWGSSDLCTSKGHIKINSVPIDMIVHAIMLRRCSNVKTKNCNPENKLSLETQPEK